MLQTTLNPSSETFGDTATPDQAQGGIRHFIEVGPNAVYTLTPDTHVVKAVSGRAWVSLDGQDHVVEPGHEISLPGHHERAVVSGLDHDAICLEIQ